MSVLKIILYHLIKTRIGNSLNHRSAIAIVLLISNLSLSAQTAITREYQLKAVFLFNFTQFVEWPSGTFRTDKAPIVIGILGKNPFGTYLEETIAGEEVNGHTVTVEYYNNAEEIKECHILFINLDESKKRDQVVAAVKGRNILTVGDAPDFSKQGGIINFLTKNNKINIQINLEASKEASLTISSKLLRLAEITVPVKNG